MEVWEAIKKRRSVRQFSDTPVNRQALEIIVDAARFAPTARNIQPWEFVVVTERKRLEEIASFADNGKFISSAQACIAVFSSETKYFLEDCSAATQNILLAACALGIGSCWVAGDKKPYAQRVAQLLAVPVAYRLVSLVALGYAEADDTQCVAQKRPLSELLHWEKF